MIRYEKLDPTEIDSGYIINGVNCLGNMGAGLAKHLYTKWGVVRDKYLKAHSDRVPLLGDVQKVWVAPEVCVLNCWTQHSYGRVKGVVYADPQAIYRVYCKVFRGLCSPEDKVVYTPMLGCGLGGLDFEHCVRGILEQAYQEQSDMNTEVVVFYK